MKIPRVSSTVTQLNLLFLTEIYSISGVPLWSISEGSVCFNCFDFIYFQHKFTTFYENLTHQLQFWGTKSGLLNVPGAKPPPTGQMELLLPLRKLASFGKLLMVKSCVCVRGGLANLQGQDPYSQVKWNIFLNINISPLNGQSCIKCLFLPVFSTFCLQI